MKRKLIAYRRKHNLSQAALANLLGVHVCTVLRWENGQADPNPLAQKALEALFAESASKATKPRKTTKGASRA